MFTTRRVRAMVWLVGGASIIAGLLFIPKEQRASGPCEVRSGSRVEVRAPVAGFIRDIEVYEGAGVAVHAMVVRIEVPELVGALAQKRAEIAEGESQLALAEAGPRTPATNMGRELRARVAEQALARATLSRLTAELAQLEETEVKQRVYSPVAGLVVTPRLHEQAGRFARG